MKKNINWGEIKRQILKRDMNLDTRFSTKVGSSKKIYKRSEQKKNLIQYI
jgi:hypothetical protein